MSCFIVILIHWLLMGLQQKYYVLFQIIQYL